MHLFWFVHQLKPRTGGFLRPPSLSQGYFVFCLYTENANLSIYPALPACPLRSLCSSHQRYLALFYWQFFVTFWFMLLFLHHIHTGRYARWVFVRVICVDMCEKKEKKKKKTPCCPKANSVGCFMLEITHLRKDGMPEYSPSCLSVHLSL